MLEINQQVVLTPFYKEQYPNWKVEIGKVISLKDTKEIHANELPKEFRAMYSSKYGKKDIYPVISYLVEFNNETYLVSDLGIEAV